MKWIGSAVTAFLMYSRVPAPAAAWDRENTRFTLGFFPAVGALLGVLFAAAFFLLEKAGAPALLSGALLTALPVLYTGGIHMDGFLDTSDALGSNGSREDKLRILKDPHTGAFAVTACALRFLLTFAAYASFQDERTVLLVSGFFVLSRTLSAAALLTIPNARREGLAKFFTDAADARVTAGLLIFWGALSAVLLIVISPLKGAALLLTAAASFVSLRVRSVRNFGGLTGDVAGWFLERTECAGAVVAAFLAFL